MDGAGGKRVELTVIDLAVNAPQACAADIGHDFEGLKLRLLLDQQREPHQAVEQRAGNHQGIEAFLKDNRQPMGTNSVRPAPSDVPISF